MLRQHASMVDSSTITFSELCFQERCPLVLVGDHQATFLLYSLSASRIIRAPLSHTLMSNIERTKMISRLLVQSRPQEWSQQQPVKREVVGVAFVHDFHAETSSVQDVRPRIDDVTFTVLDGLVEVKSIEVESHGADT